MRRSIARLRSSINSWEIFTSFDYALPYHGEARHGSKDASIPPDRFLAEIDVDLLGFEEFLGAVEAQLAALAALLVAAPRTLDVTRLHGINPDDPGPEVLRHA